MQGLTNLKSDTATPFSTADKPLKSKFIINGEKKKQNAAQGNDKASVIYSVFLALESFSFSVFAADTDGIATVATP
jgi:hypothetical protein